ncbi:hypothetical protein ACFWU5_06360 [Nocardia sp. NPDC058640]|uniref:hypothetical protein n=1 Tax=Nocardia sp. NPDC058640 TaxID=3346571 RepID=UPI00364DBA5F
MKPEWSSDREPNLDPAVEEAVRGVMAAIADLDTAVIRAQNLDIQAILDQPTEVNDSYMLSLSMMSDASSELQAYAARVQRGECQWSEIELAQPLPPEVYELKTSPLFDWRLFPAPSPMQVDTPPARPQSSQYVYDDYDEEDQAPDSWLE